MHANDAAALPVGARVAGMGGVSLGMPGDPSHLAVSPAGLADITRAEVVVHHASLYEGLSLAQDEVYLAAPLSYGVLGLGISRVGADGILRSERGVSPEFGNPATFSATDWIASVGFARSWFDHRLRGGASLRLLGRDIDGYYGAGSQLDASVVWVQDGFRTGLRLDRGLGGVATWESGRSEYSPPDLVAGVGYENRLPYFYGRGSLAWETSGLLQAQAASSFSASDARPWVDPWLALRSSRLGGEFQFDMGLVLRAGCEIQALTRMLAFVQGEDQQGQFGESRGSVSVGAGYLWSNKVRIDYALVAHPDLGNTQRLSLGLVFGSGPKSVPVVVPADESAPREPSDLPAPADSLLPSPPAAPVEGAVAPVPVPSVSDTASAATPAVPAPGPRQTEPVKPVPNTQPVPPKPVPADEWDAPEQPAP